jgi:hypothetical protein
VTIFFATALGQIPGLLTRRSDWQQAPQVKNKRVAAVALERHSGHTLVNSFFRAGRGRGKRLVRSSEFDRLSIDNKPIYQVYFS